MVDQLPTPGLELFLLNVFLSSLTFLTLVLLFTWHLKRIGAFNWKSYMMVLIATFIIGNMGAIMIWTYWPFSFDIMVGPIHLPGLISFGLLIWIGKVLIKR